MLLGLRYRTSVLGVCAAAVVLTVASSASAQNGHSLREALTGRPAADGRSHADAPPVAKYASQSGSRFIVDRSGRDLLFKFEHSPEIWVLRPTPAPGGDVIWRNDVGDPVLRASRLGGMTLFTQERPMGAPAAMLGPGSGFKPNSMSPTLLLARLAQASQRTSEAAGRLIGFDAPDINAGSDFVIADAAMIVAQAMTRLKRTPGGQRALSRIRSVRITEGRRASADLRNGVLEVVVVPSEGLAGRPSSGRVIQAAMQ